mgnify:CR=1 FL=1
MLKILKNLKKNWVAVIVIILLLCVQAWADLALPDYTSKIVNIGIQQGGIEASNPDVIAKKQILERLPAMQGQSDSIIEQAAIAAVKEDYKLSGVDTDKMQKKMQV